MNSARIPDPQQTLALDPGVHPRSLGSADLTAWHGLCLFDLATGSTQAFSVSIDRHNQESLGNRAWGTMGEFGMPLITIDRPSCTCVQRVQPISAAIMPSLRHKESTAGAHSDVGAFGRRVTRTQDARSLRVRHLRTGISWQSRYVHVLRAEPCEFGTHAKST